MSDRSGLKWVKVKRFLKLLFAPGNETPYLSVGKFEEVPIDRLLQDGIEGVLIDADGTLGPHHAPCYSDSVVAHLYKMQEAGLSIAIFTNDRDDRFSQLEGIPIVTDVAPKPDPHGFISAMTLFLNLKDPGKVVMIGDNFMTDGGAIEAEMRFLYVTPVPGDESPIHKLTRFLAKRCAAPQLIK